jgi:hypothetical protein
MNLWQGVIGLNNPCPTGYRLPSIAELDAEQMSWSSQDDIGAISSPLKLPLGGWRHGIDGALMTVGSNGSYWSSTVSGGGSRSLYIENFTFLHYGNTRGSGMSVRCLKE